MDKDQAIDEALRLMETCRDGGFLTRRVRRLLAPFVGTDDLEYWEALARRRAAENGHRAGRLREARQRAGGK